MLVLDELMFEGKVEGVKGLWLTGMGIGMEMLGLVLKMEILFCEGGNLMLL